jgi:hypothetical protein
MARMTASSRIRVVSQFEDSCELEWIDPPRRLTGGKWHGHVHAWTHMEVTEKEVALHVHDSILRTDFRKKA